MFRIKHQSNTKQLTLLNLLVSASNLNMKNNTDSCWQARKLAANELTKVYKQTNNTLTLRQKEREREKNLNLLLLCQLRVFKIADNLLDTSLTYLLVVLASLKLLNSL